MFASRTMVEHLLRGLVGGGAIALAIRIGTGSDALHVVGSLGLGVLAMIALRGCPICWTTGLAAMIRIRLRAASSHPALEPGARAP